ncbi:protein FAR1-RELATED SEQUENCE 5-like [Olea europaea var. sylvestris]|uniref:protein FAR1-RELATED SEQUENCE 5-like n=1 Tax=Olea europaea var. sylvestris TaxID=158386 RepID=UPI000C1CCDAD|nr:protein FAR1-RELATED SEQUENCE 5-like [Olea europaea var. sylvestris]
MRCIEKDCQNYIEQVRRLKLTKGDAAAIQSYFSKMQAQCSGFYFSMDVDDESRLKNIFWADSRCRQSYKEFGDIVTFDTTYLTNKYDMTFTSFVGVNYHGQSILLDCGLFSNEDTNTFVWLFQTWLHTKHRWCLWHFLKKLPEKFGYHVEKASIFGAIHELVHESQFVQEFESGWRVMIDMYALRDNDWLSGLYENRARWVLCYFKTSFWAGMSTTQRSESMNAFFDRYVHSKTSFKQFVDQYERALRSKLRYDAMCQAFAQVADLAADDERSSEAIMDWIKKEERFDVNIREEIEAQ